MLSVKEIGDILAEPLRVCGATVAYLVGSMCGPIAPVTSEWATN